MRKTRSTPFLDRAEWDFTKIQDHELTEAAVWEYGRTCEDFRKTAVALLETVVDGLTIRQRLGLHIKNPEDLSVFPILTKIIGELCSLKKVPRPVLESILAIFEIMATSGRADFPAPWTAVKRRERELLEPDNSPLLEIHSLLTEQNICDKIRQNAISAPKNYFGLIDDTFVMVIKRNGKVERLISEFSKWVRKEAKKEHPRKLGQPAHAPTHPLKCLSAYRLNQAGFTFSQAQDFIHQHYDSSRLVPLFAEASGWSDALRFARQKIKNLAST
jgi:hypothetical protein